MALAVSNYLATALLNQVFRNTAFTRPATVHLALYTSDPTGADTGAEVSSGAYARQAVAFAAPSLVSGKETIKSTADITFPVATADWGSVTHAGIRDAASGGNLLYYGPLDAVRSILNGDRLVVPQDSCALTLS
jgi:hypothetical protein